MRLASIRLVARDTTALAKFYEQITGVAPFTQPSFPGYAEIRLPSFTIAIVDEEGVERFNAGAASAAANRSAILEFEVDDVDAERDRIAHVVADWVLPPTTQPWGNRSMLFRDPDGTLINVYAPVKR